MSHGKSHHKHSEAKYGKRDSDQHSGQPPIKVPPTATESEPPKPPNGSSIPKQCKRDWFDYSKFAVEVIGLVFLITYTVYAGLQWCEMRKATQAATSAANTAAKQLELAERPWISMDIGITGPVAVTEQGLIVPIGVRLKNIGNSPAVAVRLNTVIIQSPEGLGSDTQAINERDRACNDVKNEVSGGNDAKGETIFPTSEGTQRLINTVIPRPLLNEIVSKFGGVSPMIVNCAAYHLTFNKTVHATGKVILILNRNSQFGVGKVIVPLNGEMLIPQDKIMAVPSFVAGTYAD